MVNLVACVPLYTRPGCTFYRQLCVYVQACVSVRCVYGIRALPSLYNLQISRRSFFVYVLESLPGRRNGKGAAYQCPTSNQAPGIQLLSYGSYAGEYSDKHVAIVYLNFCNQELYIHGVYIYIYRIAGLLLTDIYTLRVMHTVTTTVSYCGTYEQHYFNSSS